MSLFKNIIQKSQTEENRDTLAKALETLIIAITNITEYSQRELKAISILSTNRYIKEMLELYVPNKKHLKRKHSLELLKSLKYVSQALSVSNDNSFNLGLERKGK